MKKLRNRARPGDLLFYRVTPQSGWLARLIAMAQFWRKEGAGAVQYSHVAIVRNQDECIEAAWPKIRCRPIDWDADVDLCRLYRMGKMRASHMINSAEAHLGDWYGLGQLLFWMFPFWRGRYCTTLVQECAIAAGYDLADLAGNVVSPNELIEDKQVKRVY